MHSVLFTKQPGLLKQYKQHVHQQGAGHGQGAPGHPPLPAGDHEEKPLSSVAVSKAEKKKKEGIFSLGEVARIRNIEMWAPWISADQRVDFSSLQNASLLGWGDPQPGDRTVGATWLGLGQELPVPVGPGHSSAHVDGYRGGSTRCHQHFLYKREWMLQANYALFHGWKESKEV